MFHKTQRKLLLKQKLDKRRICSLCECSSVKSRRWTDKVLFAGRPLFILLPLYNDLIPYVFTTCTILQYQNMYSIFIYNFQGIPEIRTYYLFNVASHVSKQKHCRQITFIVYVCNDITRSVLTTNVIDLSLSQATTIPN